MESFLFHTRAPVEVLKREKRLHSMFRHVAWLWWSLEVAKLIRGIFTSVAVLQSWGRVCQRWLIYFCCLLGSGQLPCLLGGCRGGKSVSIIVSNSQQMTSTLRRKWRPHISRLHLLVGMASSYPLPSITQCSWPEAVSWFTQQKTKFCRHLTGYGSRTPWPHRRVYTGAPAIVNLAYFIANLSLHLLWLLSPHCHNLAFQHLNHIHYLTNKVHSFSIYSNSSGQHIPPTGLCS